MFGRRYPVRRVDPWPDVLHEPSIGKVEIGSERDNGVPANETPKAAMDRAVKEVREEQDERYKNALREGNTTELHRLRPAFLLVPAFAAAVGAGLGLGAYIVMEANESREPVRVTVYSDPDQQGYGVSSDGETPLPAITDVKVEGDCVLMKKKNDMYLVWECVPR